MNLQSAVGRRELERAAATKLHWRRRLTFNLISLFDRDQGVGAVAMTNCIRSKHGVCLGKPG
jgi:hypothetical protein